MTTRRIFLQPDEIIEIMSNEGHSCLKLEVQQKLTAEGTPSYPYVRLWPQPKIMVQVATATDLIRLPDDYL